MDQIRQQRRHERLPVLVLRELPALGAAVAEKIRAGGGTARAYQCDVSRRDQVRKLVEDVTGAWGTVDILVSNAGIMINKPVEDYTEDGTFFVDGAKPDTEIASATLVVVGRVQRK